MTLLAYRLQLKLSRKEHVLAVFALLALVYFDLLNTSNNGSHLINIF